MSANAQTSSSTEVGTEPPAVAGQNNAGKNKKNNLKPAAVNGATPKPAAVNGATPKPAAMNGTNAATTTNAKPATENSGKNPALEKITASLSALEGSLQGSDCNSIQGKAKQVIENADPVIEAIESQQLRENNSQLSEVKGKVKSVTNSIRSKCPKGAASTNAKGTNAKPNGQSSSGQFVQVNRINGSPMTRKNAKQEAPKVGQLWNVITSWAQGNTRSGYDAIVKITKVDDAGVTFEATEVKQTAQLNGIEKDEERTYSMEEWKALRKVLEKNANNAQGGGRRKTRRHKRKGRKSRKTKSRK